MVAALNAIAHFLVDWTCVCALYSGGVEGQALAVAVVLYNTLAFSTQCVVGLLLDVPARKRRLVPFCGMWQVAGMFLVEDSGDRSQPGSDGITLRFYRQSKADVRISLAPVGEDDLIETDGVWNEKGYWSVPYLQEGTYFLLQ